MPKLPKKSRSLKKSKTVDLKSEAKKFLAYLNREYSKLHTKYERAFWECKMGRQDELVMNAAMRERDDFRSNTTLQAKVKVLIASPKIAAKDKRSLSYWENFFKMYTTPSELKPLRKEIAELEAEIARIRNTRKEGYIDPSTGRFMEASENKMRFMVSTESDWRLRKACFDAMEKFADLTLPQYAKLISLRNQYARALGYENFYDFKLRVDEKISTKELRNIFDPIYEKTKYAFEDIKALDAKRKEELKDGYLDDRDSMLKPWNFYYMIAGDLTKEKDQYFPFERAVEIWQKSMINMGVSFANGVLRLDLLDRKGKYSNGFCHYPKLVQYPSTTGEANFTCNVVPGQIGSSAQGYNTLFHEGGHAAHLLNSKQAEVCVNHEYPPTSVSLAETQSMFMDSIMSSIDWLSKYAKNRDGVAYPFELFEKSVRQLHLIRPLGMMGISMVVDYELSLYSMPDSELTVENIKSLARDMLAKYTAYS